VPLLKSRWARVLNPSPPEHPYTPRVKKVLALAGKEAKALNHSYVGTEHILLGLLREGEGVAARVLKSLDVDIERCRNEILSELDPNFAGDSEEPAGPPPVGGPPPSVEERKELKTPALKAFGRDLTDLARAGEMDPVIGRKEEIRRVIQILCRRTKNNPVLIGEAGVGKTAIVEGLARKSQCLVPEILPTRGSSPWTWPMVAGRSTAASSRSASRRDDEIRRAKTYHLHRRTAHHRGAGAPKVRWTLRTSSSPPVPCELQCIGATTLAEYRKYIEKDSALDRRFQSVKVEAPSAEDSLRILQGIAPKYEAPQGDLHPAALDAPCASRTAHHSPLPARQGDRRP
jgi:ATP-dependent Clp protease ATP-binding subunit ClpC